MKMPKIEEFKTWNKASVRNACIRNDLYTNGTNDDYMNMLDWVSRLYPNVENMWFIAEDIVRHSDGLVVRFGEVEADDEEAIMNVMFILNAEAVTTSYYRKAQ